MKLFFKSALILIVLGSEPVLAGAVMEMSMRQSEGQAASVMERIYAQDGKLRIDTMDGRDGIMMTILFVNGELIQIGHRDRSFNRINQKSLAEMRSRTASGHANMMQHSGEMADAMRQMQQQMANMPPEQRRMMEQMMKGKMPGASPQPEPTGIQVESRGTGKWQGYTCKNYTVRIDSSNRHELCAASADQIEGADEIVSAMRGMKTFNEQFRASMPQAPFGSPAGNPYEIMEKIQGFPVFRREFNEDHLLGERFMSSSRKQKLPGSTFEIPDGYNEEALR